MAKDEQQDQEEYDYVSPPIPDVATAMSCDAAEENKQIRARMADLETAYRVLSRMVYDEYGGGLQETLAEIAATWDIDSTEDEVAALRRLETPNG